MNPKSLIPNPIPLTLNFESQTLNPKSANPKLQILSVKVRIPNPKPHMTKLQSHTSAFTPKL